MMRRVVGSLSTTPVVWINSDGASSEFKVNLSVGVSECTDYLEIRQAFEAADKASYASKGAGGGKVSLAEVSDENLANHI